MTKIAIGIGGLGLVAVGCNASTMIGDLSQDGGVPPNIVAVGTLGHTCEPPPFPGDHPFTFPAGLGGVWTGFVQGGVLGLSSDAVRLTMDEAADGTPQIHVVYGVAAPPPPATVATDYYPPGMNPLLPPPPFIEGYSYLAHNVNWEAFGEQWRLRFAIDESEPWAGWCHLQLSYIYQSSTQTIGSQGDPPFFQCIPQAPGGYLNLNGSMECEGLDTAGNPIFTISCAQVNMCNGRSYCVCDTCGCDSLGISNGAVPTEAGAYDLLFDATSATGSGPNATTGGNLQLMRSAN
jgi:hypothetical protein